MMKRIAALALVATFVLGAFASAQAATEVKMTGDARIYGVFFANHNFTGWNTSSWTSATSPTSATQLRIAIAVVRVVSGRSASSRMKFPMQPYDTANHAMASSR